MAWTVLLACWISSGCGYIGIGVGAAMSGGGGGGGGAAASAPVLSLADAAPSHDDHADATGEPNASHIAVAYTLSSGGGSADIAVEWKLRADPDASFASATPGPGSEATSGLATSAAGVPHLFVWDAEGDLGARGLVEEEAVLRLTPTAAGLSGAPRTVELLAGNRAPAIDVVAPGDAPLARIVFTQFRASDTSSASRARPRGSARRTSRARRAPGRSSSSGTPRPMSGRPRRADRS